MNFETLRAHTGLRIVADEAARLALENAPGELIPGDVVVEQLSGLSWRYTAPNTWLPYAAGGLKYVGRSGGLPDPSTTVLTDGQLFVVRMDFGGEDLYRLVAWDESIPAKPGLPAGGWRWLNREVWDKGQRSDADQATDQRPGDLQVTRERDHQELKAWNAVSNQWDTIYSRDEINAAIAALSLFEGTAEEVGGGAIGAVEFDALPDLAALSTAGDLSLSSHYWTYIGSPNYPVTAATPNIGVDLDGAVLNPGDWIQISNRGGDGTGTGANGGAPDLHWVTIGGDLLAKARADRLFGLQPWAAGGWEQGALVVFQGDVYRATRPVTGSDPDPTSPSTPWAIVDISGGLKVATDMNGLPATAPPGQVWIVLAGAGSKQELYSYDGGVAQWQELGGGGTPLDLSGGVALVSVGVPVGSITAFAGSTAPMGWLPCDGRTISTSQYPDLQRVIGSSRVPDLRGQFIRGASAPESGYTKHPWSTGMPRNRFRADTNGLHNHSPNPSMRWHGLSDGSGAANLEWNRGATVSANDWTQQSGSHVHTISGGDSETVPNHVLLMYIIKATDSVAVPQTP